MVRVRDVPAVAYAHRGIVVLWLRSDGWWQVSIPGRHKRVMSETIAMQHALNHLHLLKSPSAPDPHQTLRGW